MISIKEEIYVWLSLIDNLNYLIYLKLIQIFDSSIKLYNISKDKNKFKEHLKSNNFNLEENLINKITDSNFKSKANIIYNNLKSNNIKIIPINSKYYPNNLKNIFSPPLCLFVKGDIEKIDKRKIYVYKNNNITKYAKKIVYLLYNYIIKEDKYLILNKNLFVKGINIENIDFNIESNENIYIYYNVNDKKNDIKEYEIISGILDLLIIPEADYNKEITIFVDTFLELGKEMVIFPNEIFNKNAYFSNYLIKNGADIVTNIYQVSEVLNKLEND